MRGRNKDCRRDGVEIILELLKIKKNIPMKYDITALYCCIADFVRVYKDFERNKLIATGKIRDREGKLHLSEQLLIMICFHLSPIKDFKNYYIYYLAIKFRSLFRELPTYARFVQLMPGLFLPLTVLLHCLLGEETGIYFADSTKLGVCHNVRINRHKVFTGLAERGKTTMGWFYGFKLHMVINHKGEIVAVKITKGNVDDREPLEELTKRLKGSVYADKGYISQNLFTKLWNKGLRLIVGIKRNMKNYLIDLLDKTLLRKRFLIETAFFKLKQVMNLEHTRHRSPTNFCINILSSLCAYALTQHKKIKPNLFDKLDSLIHN